MSLNTTLHTIPRDVTTSFDIPNDQRARVQMAHDAARELIWEALYY